MVSLMAQEKNRIDIATPPKTTKTRLVLFHDIFRIKTALRCLSHLLGMMVVRWVEAAHLFHRVCRSSKRATRILSSRLPLYKKLCSSLTKKLSQQKNKKSYPASKKLRQRADSKMLCQCKHKDWLLRTKNGSKKLTQSSSKSRKIELYSKTLCLKNAK